MNDRFRGAYSVISSPRLFLWEKRVYNDPRVYAEHVYACRRHNAVRRRGGVRAEQLVFCQLIAGMRLYGVQVSSVETKLHHRELQTKLNVGRRNSCQLDLFFLH